MGGPWPPHPYTCLRPWAYPSIIGTFRTQRHSSWMISARAELSDDLSERSLFEGKKERVKLATEHKRSLHYRNLGHVWSIISNSHFYILNNITHFFTHFFTYTYFKKLQTTFLKLLYQTPP